MPGRIGTGARLAALHTETPMSRVCVLPSTATWIACTVRVPSPAVVCRFRVIVAMPGMPTTLFGAGLEASVVVPPGRVTRPLLMCALPVTAPVLVLNRQDEFTDV